MGVCPYCKRPIEEFMVLLIQAKLLIVKTSGEFEGVPLGDEDYFFCPFCKHQISGELEITKKFYSRN